MSLFNNHGIAGYWKCPECSLFQVAARPLICDSCGYHYEPEDFYQDKENDNEED